MAELRRPCAELAPQRFRKVFFAPAFPRDVRQPFSVSGYAIAEEVLAPEMIVRTFGSTQKKVHPQRWLRDRCVPIPHAQRLASAHKERVRSVKAKELVR